MQRSKTSLEVEPKDNPIPVGRDFGQQPRRESQAERRFPWETYITRFEHEHFEVRGHPYLAGRTISFALDSLNTRQAGYAPVRNALVLLTVANRTMVSFLWPWLQCEPFYEGTWKTF